MFSQHIPVLIIVLPLIAAPICVILRHSVYSWLIALITSVSIFILSCSVLAELMSGAVIRYDLGGWAAPTGIEYYIDSLNAGLLVLISLISSVCLVYAKKAVEHEIALPRHYLFYSGWLLCLTGLLGIVITGDAFNVFVFLEISSLSMYMLIALGSERKQALLAAFRYLIMGSIGASFILLGIGFLYAATGTLNMSDLSDRLALVGDSRTVVVGFTLITLGLLIKAAVFPVYSWLPNAYQYSPTAVTAFLAGTATKVSLYVFLRFFFHVFGAEFTFAGMLLDKLLLPLAVVGFFVMSVVAIFQTDIRRILAYSSIAQLGYMFTAICMANQAGLTAAIIYIVNHAVIKTALFIAVGCIFYRVGSARLSDHNYLIQSMPWTVSAFIVAGLSIVGLPITAGFVSKWYLVSAAIESGWWPIAVMILLSSLMAIMYIGKIIEVFCFNTNAKSTSQKPEIKESPFIMLLPLWFLVLLSLYIGINPSFVVDFAELAASQLMGGMQ